MEFFVGKTLYWKNMVRYFLNITEFCSVVIGILMKAALSKICGFYCYR